MFQIERTARFDDWLTHLKDKVGKQRILARLSMLALGHWGDCRPVGESVTELKIHIGPGYRVYCWQDGAVIVVALCGGDKGSQARDIAEAQTMAQQLKADQAHKPAKSTQPKSGKA
jgi:putative addiction module killer protein